MDNKALYLLAQFDAKTEQVLSDYYKILQQHGLIGSQTKNIPYHFTLGSYDTNQENRLILELETICNKTSEIELRLGHIGLFGLNVLFVEPNMNFELLSLQKSFFDNCGNGYHPWTAHATLLIDEPENILKALRVINQEFKPMHSRIESVALYEFFPTRFIKRCGLQRT
jgi:2'-5' RNA ligase